LHKKKRAVEEKNPKAFGELRRRGGACGEKTHHGDAAGEEELGEEGGNRREGKNE